MTDRVRELAERRAALRLRCAAQRRTVARAAQALEQRFGTVDRVAAITRGVFLHPAVVAVGVTLVFALGRSRVFHLIGRGLLLAAGARRLLQTAKKI